MAHFLAGRYGTCLGSASPTFISLSRFSPNSNSYFLVFLTDFLPGNSKTRKCATLEPTKYSSRKEPGKRWAQLGKVAYLVTDGRNAPYVR